MFSQILMLGFLLINVASGFSPESGTYSEKSDKTCIKFTLGSKSNSDGWESTKLRVVGKSGYHKSFAPAGGQQINTDYCFDSSSSKNGDIVIAGAYGLNADDNEQIYWSATEPSGVTYNGTYMTFMTFEYNTDNGKTWTTLKESHNIVSTSAPPQTKSKSKSATTSSTSPSSSSSIDSQATTTDSSEITSAAQSYASSSSSSSSTRWTIQGSVSLCGFNKEITQQQSELITTVLVDTLNAASINSDVESGDVSILFWESTASPADASASTLTHKVFFSAAINPQSFGYQTIESSESEEAALTERIEGYFQTSIDSGMFLSELSDLVATSNAGKFCGIKSASMQHMVSKYNEESELDKLAQMMFSRETLTVGIVISALVIGVFLIFIGTKISQIKLENEKRRFSAISESPLNVSEAHDESKLPTYKLEDGVFKPDWAKEANERKFSKPALTLSPTATNLHDTMIRPKDLNEYYITTAAITNHVAQYSVAMDSSTVSSSTVSLPASNSTPLLQEEVTNVPLEVKLPIRPCDYALSNNLSQYAIDFTTTL